MADFTVALPDVGDPVGPDAIASLIAAVNELREQVGNQSGTPAPGSITADMLAANAVTGDKIAAGAVTSAKIATGAVTAAKIAGGVIHATPTADTLAGATAVGRSLMKAASADAARDAINAAPKA